MAHDIHELQRELERTQLELEQTKAMLDQLRRRRTPRASEPDRSPPPPAEGRASATYRVEGSAEQLATFDFLLRHVSTACEAGSTAFYQLMVDGDGAASLTIEKHGRRIAVTEAEERWLFGEGERPPNMPDVNLRSEEVLELEIV
ncbi:MAG: hypothetical protein AAF799_02095 [Myxococcota bacterium]